MDAKQTAVEWFFDKIKSHFEHDGDLFETICFTYAIAKHKEKEQIIDAIDYCRNKYIDSENYYNETYGN
jgi:hemerythrin